MSERSINDLPEGYIPKLELEEGYIPSENEEYMCDKHVEYFRRRLVQWQEELNKESQETINNLQSEVRDVGDDAERASRETENTLELRTRDRYRKLLAKIRKALTRIKEGDYGYCEDTDEEIGLRRLMARPIATMTIDAQERWELRQRLLKEGK
ncbi:MAG TPA: RNA polymerase-binding protein DksA [Gammaproteobacteria bacterium]|jgi:DnaK suppressor protein|nr:RNA polymerase-binding protein DksA [Gammaproteobacteria bacterium]HPI95159.1 RNA polymerase-binding protein DksA [Gammaproteobacteria bacterium]HPQ86696.1 RNA polymerase-binding protein DksA [Gammaproteobacteria bacterium]